MRIRGGAAGALLILTALAAVAGGRSPAIGGAPLAQMEFVRAAVHPGSCAEPAPEATVRLDEFARPDPANGAASPMLSSTAAPVALAGLLEAPHAVLVTLGGNRNAMLACGDLAGETAASSVSVDLREQNASGLSGIGLLVAGGETTRISILLDETRPSVPVAASPTVPSATREAIPSPTPRTLPATPEAITPEPTATPIAVVEPSPTGPPVATPEIAGTPDAVQTSGDTYTSAEFGYAIVIAEPWRLVDGPTVEPGTDFIAVSNGESLIDFIGIANDMTAPECIDTIYAYLPSRTGVSLVTAHTGSDAGVNLSTPERAIEVWDLVYRDAQGQASATTVYADCRVIQPGAALLVTTHEAPTASYTAQTAPREQLYEGITIP